MALPAMPLAARAALMHVVLQAAGALAAGGAKRQADANPEDGLSMMQTTLQIEKATLSRAADRAKRDLVFMHLPYNFGHVVEQMATYGSGLLNQLKFLKLLQAFGGFSGAEYSNNFVERMSTADEVLAENPPRPGGMMWGHLNPDLQVASNITGCPMFYTPPKYWPTDLAEKYFGNKTIFGIIRDPYERLIAFFRGSLPGFGGSYRRYLDTCDVNSAVKSMMKRYLAGGDRFADSCTFVPQAEYFEGRYGIQLPVNNREFPVSMNDIFLEHGYPDMVVKVEDIIHVSACREKWAADLDAETRQLVRQVYARDFELLCRHFGYCDPEENTCIWRVSGMCPEKVMEAGYRGHAL